MDQAPLSLKRLDVVTGDHWVAIYVDGELFGQQHAFSPKDWVGLMEACGPFHSASCHTLNWHGQELLRYRGVLPDTLLGIPTRYVDWHYFT